MINFYEVNETQQMIEHENLDVRTITLGISLLDCIDSNLDKLNQKVYEKITTVAKDLVVTGDQIEQEYGIPIVNKRISITPISLIGSAACKTPEDFAKVTIRNREDFAAVFDVEAIEEKHSFAADQVAYDLLVRENNTNAAYAIFKALAEEQIPALIHSYRNLIQMHQHLWEEVNKPYGWEVLCARYGGVVARLEYAGDVIGRYVSGELKAIEEFEAEPIQNNYFGSGRQISVMAD